MEKSNAVRDSNFELLRIISMFMIVVLHISTFGINNYIDIPEFLNGFTEVFYYFIRSLSIVAVSVYVLISGYFLSKSTFKPIKLVNLLLETSFFSTIIYLLIVIGGYTDFNMVELVKSMLSVFVGEYWFITVYFVLYVLSPLLNKLIDNINKTQYKYLLVISFLIFNIWDFILPNIYLGVVGGYSPLYFMFLYFLAAYIRKYGFLVKDFNKNTYLILYLGLAAVNGLVYYITEIVIGGIGRLFQYNAPLVLVMSYCLFMYFKELEIKSNKINFISRYVLGIYLVHEKSIFSGILWSEFGIVEDIISSSGILFIVKSLGYSLIIFVGCWIASYIITLVYNLLYKKTNVGTSLDKLKVITQWKQTVR